MDVTVKQVFNELKSALGLEYLICAGGACRDFVLGEDFKDIDLFTAHSNKDFIEEMFWAAYDKSDVLNSNYTFIDVKKNSYGKKQGSFTVLDLQYKRSIPVQIIQHHFYPDKDFINRILEDFNFGINKIYWDGTTLVKSDEFNFDAENSFCSLSRINSIKEFEGHLDKFLNLKMKYPRLKFKFDHLLDISLKEKRNKTTTEDD